MGNGQKNARRSNTPPWYDMIPNTSLNVHIVWGTPFSPSSSFSKRSLHPGSQVPWQLFANLCLDLDINKQRSSVVTQCMCVDGMDGYLGGGFAAELVQRDPETVACIR